MQAFQTLLRFFSRRESDKLKESIRVEVSRQLAGLDAKTCLDTVWTAAFSAGFAKAWDMMIPFMTEGVQRVKKGLEDAAIETTIKNLDPFILKKAKELHGHNSTRE